MLIVVLEVHLRSSLKGKNALFSKVTLCKRPHHPEQLPQPAIHHLDITSPPLQEPVASISCPSSTRIYGPTIVHTPCEIRSGSVELCWRTGGAPRRLLTKPADIYNEPPHSFIRNTAANAAPNTSRNSYLTRNREALPTYCMSTIKRQGR
jgi:hypothetical protein